MKNMAIDRHQEGFQLAGTKLEEGQGRYNG